MADLSADQKNRLVRSFALAETVVWAAMFYSFPAFLLEWERELGWSKVELSSAFTLALVLSAVSAPLVGRLIDSGLGRQVFLVCGTGGALFLGLLSLVTELWQFFLLWSGLGIAMSGVLYEACFAMLTRFMGRDARTAITKVALVAGFAGTLSFPGAYFLTDAIGWRGAMLAFASAVMLVAVPLVWFSSRNLEARTVPADRADSCGSPESVGLFRQATFWLLAISFAMIAFNHAAVMTHLLPLLGECGVSPRTAVLAAAMIGPMQVAGRLFVVGIEASVSSRGITVVCFLAMAAAGASLLGAKDQLLLLPVFVLLQGAGYGVTSIMRPVLVAELMGTRRFGVTAGFLAAPFLLASAAAPSIAALAWEFGGYQWVIRLAVVAAVVGLAALLAAGFVVKGHAAE